jgi:hypothetical protein
MNQTNVSELKWGELKKTNRHFIPVDSRIVKYRWNFINEKVSIEPDRKMKEKEKSVFFFDSLNRTSPHHRHRCCLPSKFTQHLKHRHTTPHVDRDKNQTECILSGQQLKRREFPSETSETGMSDRQNEIVDAGK